MKTRIASIGAVLLSLLFINPVMANGVKTKTVKIAPKVRIQYDVSGPRRAPAVLMLHGVTDSKHSWSSVAPYLNDQYRVYAPTFRGHGDSSKPAGGYQIATLAEDMITFMNRLKIDQAVVVGHSMGSFVAHQMASVYPERVSKLVLIGSTPTFVGNAVGEYLWDEAIGKADFVDPVTPEFIRDWQTGPNPVEEAFFNTVLSETAKVPARVWKLAFRTLLSDDHSRFLKDVQAPTLILWGTADPLMDAATQTALQQAIPNTTFKQYQGAGHNTHWEQPYNVATDILNFIQ